MTPHLGAVLVARAWPQQRALWEFDQWQQTKHLVDLVALPGIKRVSYYATRTCGIPQAWQGSGNRMAAYWAEDLPGIKRWMQDPGLSEAIEDGSQFFDSFNELDDSTYTGNVYQLGPRWPGDPEPSLEGCLLMQRFEVPDDQKKEFDDWVIRRHLPALRSIPGCRWAQWGKAVRGLPVQYYNSPGNRVVLVELDQPRAPDLTARFIDRIVADSLKWDRRLNYVRREVDESVASFDKPLGVST